MNQTAADVPLDHPLLGFDRFKPAASIDTLVPSAPGLYAIRVRTVSALPEPFSTHALSRGSDLVYIGEAIGQTLRKRFLGNELRGKGHGTFFRSLGAVLGYRPVAGSLHGKVRQQNYRFGRTDTAKIVEWIDANLLVSWLALDDGIHSAEVALIAEHTPLLNLRGNPRAITDLAELRISCRAIAAQPPTA